MSQNPSPKPLPSLAPRPLRSYPALSIIAGLLKVVSVLVFLGSFLAGCIMASEKGGGGGAFVASVVCGTIAAIILWACAESILVLVNMSVDLSRSVELSRQLAVAACVVEPSAVSRAGAAPPDLTDPAVVHQIIGAPRT